MKLKICHLSDTHETQKSLSPLVTEDFDFIFLTGDLTYRGRDVEMERLLSLLRPLVSRAKYVVMVFGNHELGVVGKEKYWKEKFAEIGVTLLNHESIKLGGVKIFGSPWTPWFHDWAYNIPLGQEAEFWKDIPADTQILLTHGPPKFILDRCSNGNVGDMALREKIFNDLSDLKLHCFGHIHPSYGRIEIDGKLFVNSSIMDDSYRFVNKPNTIEIEI